MKEEQRITVGFLRRELEGIADDVEVTFSGLDYGRLKRRGPKLVQIEFEQLVSRDAEGRVEVENR